MTYILSAEQSWACPNCETTDVCTVKPGQSRMHNCPGLKGLTAPLVPAGTRCKVEADEWHDYVRHDNSVMHDAEGRAISAVKVTRDDGEDVVVFPQTAQVRMEF